MHTFEDRKDGTYRIVFDGSHPDVTPTNLFDVPSFADAVRAVCVLNGGSGGFNVIQQRREDGTPCVMSLVSVPGH